MTTIAERTRMNQLIIRERELKVLLEDRDKVEAQEVQGLQVKMMSAKTVLEKLKEQYGELSKKEAELSKILEVHKEDEKYVDAGQAYMTALKDSIRSLSIVCGESTTEEDDLFLSKQLSFLDASPIDLEYMKSLKRKLEARRSRTFKTGYLDREYEPEDSEENKKRQYQLGRKIGKSSVISVH